MKTFVPNYYTDFICIADACRHSCCIGWEIDIDEGSLDRFQRVEGEMGVRLQKNICAGADGACFRLDEEDRCPFLNACGLCDLILELGADSLCQICADHPRFRNFFSDRVEIGLGLCCEAAGRLILAQKTPMTLRLLSDDGGAENCNADEAALLRLREDLIARMQKRSDALSVRVDAMLNCVQLPPLRFNLPQWAHFLQSLERLDEQWTVRLEALKSASETPFPCRNALEIPLEQLACHLLFRHLAGALEDEDLRGRVAYVALILKLINGLCTAHLKEGSSWEPEELVEIARMYSSEIEYSDENLYAILDELHRTFPEMDE